MASKGDNKNKEQGERQTKLTLETVGYILLLILPLLLYWTYPYWKQFWSILDALLVALTSLTVAHTFGWILALYGGLFGLSLLPHLYRDTREWLSKLKVRRSGGIIVFLFALGILFFLMDAAMFLFAATLLGKAAEGFKFENIPQNLKEFPLSFVTVLVSVGGLIYAEHRREVLEEAGYSSKFTRVEEAVYSGTFALLLLAFAYGTGSTVASKVLPTCALYGTFYYVAVGVIIQELLRALNKA